VVDLNGDGNEDIISGGYPGEIYFFAGNSDGTFQARAEIRDQYGEAINVGTAAVPFASDWDWDGDLDLLIGVEDGYVYLVSNESGGSALEFGTGVKLKAAGKVIEAGSGDAGPCVADWDGDGNHDLILGYGDGRVFWYPNRTARGMPELDEPVKLIASRGPTYQVESNDILEANRGGRAKVCVTDWNGDGKADLLMGTYLVRRGEPPQLTPEQEMERDQIQGVAVEVSRRYQQLRVNVMEQVYEEMGIPKGKPIPKERRTEYTQKLEEALNNQPEYEAIRSESIEIGGKLEPYRAPVYYFGWVWVFLRK